MTATRLLYFEVLSNPTNIDGQSNYDFEDHAFSFQMNRNSEEYQSKNVHTTSLVLDTLQLEVAVDSCLCLYIWGYFPMGKWRSSPLFPPGSASLIAGSL